jgi:hypothetical protein
MQMQAENAIRALLTDAGFDRITPIGFIDRNATVARLDKR